LHRIELGRGDWRSQEDLRAFMAARTDAIRLTVPRLVLVSEAKADLESLYNQLVADGIAK
jgi:hypothetical protein